MNARIEVAALTDELAVLSALRQPLEQTRAGLDAALQGRAAALTLAADVLDDVHRLTLRGWQRTAPTLESLINRPEALLVRTLRAHAWLPTERSPTDVAALAVPGSTTARWVRLAAAASAAQHHWSASSERPTGAAGLSAAAELSLVVLGVTRLDDRLGQVARRLGVDTIARDLDFARASGLHLAAERTFTRASAPDTSWDAAAPQLLKVLRPFPVRGVEDLPAGLRHLTQMLYRAPDVSPGHVAMLLTAQARMISSLAQHALRQGRARGEPSSAHLATALSNHARDLARTWDRTDRALASLTPSDPGPLQQSGECLRALTAARHIEHPQLHLLAGHVLDLAPATQACVEARIREQSWVTSYVRQDDPGVTLKWHRVSKYWPVHVADALRQLKVPILAAPSHPTTAEHLHHLAARSTTVSGPPAGFAPTRS